MLTREIKSQSIPSVHRSDKVYQVLQLMNDNQVTHLPITDGDVFVGIISENDLLQAENDHALLSTLQQSFADFSVKEEEHFLKAVQLAGENGLSIVPIVSEDNLLTGVVSYETLLKEASAFMSLNEPGGLIVLEIESNSYSFSEITQIVESNDAQITQLNTSNNIETGLMLVTIRINKSEVSDIVSSFQRYDYSVKYFLGEEMYENELKTNFDNLMSYLKI